MKTVKSWTLPKACVRDDAEAVADAPRYICDLSVISQAVVLLNETCMSATALGPFLM